MSWNYRIGTKIFSYKDTFEGKNEKLAKNSDTRFFSIIEIYYDENGVPKAYADEINPLKNWESMDELKNTYDLIKLAYEKPIIDLDNFPNEYNK